jgi:hypothetical protein
VHATAGKKRARGVRPAGRREGDGSGEVGAPLVLLSFIWSVRCVRGPFKVGRAQVLRTRPVSSTHAREDTR